MPSFLIGNNGQGATFLFFGHASRGKLCYDIWLRRHAAGFFLSCSHGEGGSGVVCIGRVQWQKCDETPLKGGPFSCDL